MNIQLGIPPITTPIPFVISEYLNQVSSEMAQKVIQNGRQTQHAIHDVMFTPPAQFNPSQNISQGNSKQSSNHANDFQQFKQHANNQAVTQAHSVLSQNSTHSSSLNTKKTASSNSSVSSQGAVPGSSANQASVSKSTYGVNIYA